MASTANVLILAGSPRENSRSLKFATELFESRIEQTPDCEVTLISIADMDISGCCGCDGCKEPLHECVIDDDMADVLEYVCAADEIVVVTPVYMAGVPSQLKAVLDRFQPMFWADVRHSKEPPKPATIHLFGEGNDPYGADGANLTLKSALKVAGFEVKGVETHIN